MGPGRARRYRVIFITPGRGGAKGERDCQYFVSEADAARAIRGFFAQSEQLAGLTVDGAIELYQNDCRERGLRHVTVYNNEKLLRNFFRKWADTPLKALDPALAAEIFWGRRDALGNVVEPGWANSLTSRGTPRGKWTQSQGLVVVKTFCTFLVERRLLSANPFTGLRVKGKPRPNRPQLTHDETGKFLVTAMAVAEKGQQGGLAAAFCLVLAMRRGEIANLRCCDVDQGGRLIHIREHIEPRPWKPKTADSARALIVPVEWAGLVARYRGSRPGNEPLFPRWGKPGEFNDPQWVLYWVEKVCSLAQVSRVTPHGLRGTHGSMVRPHGATSEMLMAQFGHSEERTQIDHYVRPEAVQAATQDAFNRLVREAIERIQIGSIADPDEKLARKEKPKLQ
jgi:integrase